MVALSLTKTSATIHKVEIIEKDLKYGRILEEGQDHFSRHLKYG